MSDNSKTWMQKFIKVLGYPAVMALLVGIGYGIGSADKCTAWYNSAIEDTKKLFQVQLYDGQEFYFGGIKFIPREDGAIILKTADACSAISTANNLEAKLWKY